MGGHHYGGGLREGHVTNVVSTLTYSDSRTKTRKEGVEILMLGRGYMYIENTHTLEL